MTRIRIILFVSIIAFINSCKEGELICETPGCLNQIVEEENQPVFIDDQGRSYSLGLDCGTPSGDYSIPSDEFALQDLIIPNSLPEEFDLSALLPPVGNQGNQGSCVSWAVTYYMKSFQEKIQYNHNYDDTTILSPAYTYNQITKGQCGGTSITVTLDILKDKGAVSLDIFPYLQSECHKQPTTEADALAENAKIKDYKILSGIDMVDEMKTLLTEQIPIIISAVLDQEFGKKDALNLTAYREHDVTYDGAGCHAMLVVGYSNTNNAFKVVNSWGTNWGDNGFVWIDYKAFENVLKTQEKFRVITGAYIATDTI